MTIAEFLRQMADAYDPDDEIEMFMIKAGDDERPIFWPPFPYRSDGSRGGDAPWLA